jgi:hypothetical protein
MSHYLGPEIVLAEAQLQVEALGEGVGVVIVEGDSDRRVLAPRWIPIERVVVATNKDFVVGAHAAMRDQHRGRIICLVDCDDDVARGDLRGAPDLVITTHGDIEADLVALGALRGVVGQLVRDALSSPERFTEVAEATLERSAACAIVVGRLRRAARAAGIALDFQPWDFDYRTVRASGTSDVDAGAALDELARVTRLTQRQRARIDRELPTVRADYHVCNGKDVLAAAESVLVEDFAVARREVRTLTELVRLALDPQEFEEWDVVRRVRRWEQEHRVQLLARAA